MSRSLTYSISNGDNEQWLYPEDIDYLLDGLKSLELKYRDLNWRLYCAGMPNSRGRIENKINDIHKLIELLGGCDDNTFSDITLQN